MIIIYFIIGFTLSFLGFIGSISSLYYEYHFEFTKDYKLPTWYEFVRNILPLNEEYIVTVRRYKRTTYTETSDVVLVMLIHVSVTIVYCLAMIIAWPLALLILYLSRLVSKYMS